MMLSSDKKTIAENKLMILYILDKLNYSIDSDSLFKLVLTASDMNYFYFQQFLLDLIDSNYVISYENDDNSLVYKITDNGVQALSLTKELLPGIIKLKIDSHFKDELNSIKEDLMITSEYVPINDNEFFVKCKINENSNSVFEVKVFAGDSEKAKEIADNWKEKANIIYPKILELLYTQK